VESNLENNYKINACVELRKRKVQKGGEKEYLIRLYKLVIQKRK